MKQSGTIRVAVVVHALYLPYALNGRYKKYLSIRSRRHAIYERRDTDDDSRAGRRSTSEGPKDDRPTIKRAGTRLDQHDGGVFAVLSART